MPSMILEFSADEHAAIKRYARDHGFGSKSEAVLDMLENWLMENNYLDIDYYLEKAGYENV